MPLNNTRVMPDGWEEHHAPVSNDAMTATCVITRSGGAGTYNAATRSTVYPEATTVYSGRCRVTPGAQMAWSREPVVGDQAKPLVVYEVEIPLAAARVLVGDFVEVTCAVDSDMVGRRLQVLSYPAGTAVWDRNLICQEVQPAGR